MVKLKVIKAFRDKTVKTKGKGKMRNIGDVFEAEEDRAEELFNHSKGPFVDVVKTRTRASKEDGVV